MRAWNWVPVLMFSVAVNAAAATAHNEKLADVMDLLADQAGGISEVSKKVPAEIDAKAFARVTARARGARWLLATLAERAGSVVDGKLVAAELTPGKFLDVSGEDLEALAKKYADLLSTASVKFANAEAALKKQAALDVTKRDFTELKTVVKEITATMIAGHQIFKP